jgi:hypothetical protein
VDLGGREHLTINRPQTAGADLQEAGVATASMIAGAGAMGGEATAAAGAGMEMSLGCGSATDPTVLADSAATFREGVGEGAGSAGCSWSGLKERKIRLPTTVARPSSPWSPYPSKKRMSA